jgi:hypothetical protein
MGPINSLREEDSVATVIKWARHPSAKKTNGRARFVIILFLILAVSSLAACTPPIPLGTPTTLVGGPAVAGEQTETPTINAPPTAIPTETAAAISSPASASDAGSLIFVAEADARVKQSSPDTNYGNGTTLQVDNASDLDLESFIRFTVAGVSGSVQSARVRLYATDNGTENGPAIYAADPAWDEQEITWNKRPTRTSDALDNKDVINKNSWVEYDVTSSVTGNGTYSFALVGDSADGVILSSRQGMQPPQLVVTFGGEATPITTPTTLPTESPDSVTFVGAGDISSCDNNGDELTAQLIENMPGTVFTAGDEAYDNGTASEFQNCYDPTWGRFKDRTKPVPGNHEYHTSGASGYFQYFDNVPSYYAYNLGTWRIYALNSEIDVSASSDQVKWLEADLAANPTQCVLTYWHQPRWSSGSHHGSNPTYQTLWQTLYEAGAELVINGHEHNYERFAPMNPAGQADPLGLREFVVGTGGMSHYGFGTILHNSEVRDETSFGVLKLTLRPGAYDWQFIPGAGSTFTDSGSGTCH